MALYIDQIKKRRQMEEAALAEALEKGARQMGFQRKKITVPQSDESALRQLLDALNIKDYELEDDGLKTPEEQLIGVLRPRGIMMRQVRLKGKWWMECVGPLLGRDKQGRLLALIPNSLGLGYEYRNKHGELRKINRNAMEQELGEYAYTFTKPLPNKKLGIKDLVAYMWSVIPIQTLFLMAIAALLVVLTGMFTPMVNKIIFDSIIPTGDTSDLPPIIGLLVGAVVCTLLLTFSRNLFIMRVQNIVELHTQNAVMARTFLLSPQFFSKSSSGELTRKLYNVTTLCSLVSEQTLGALLSSAISIIYLVQLWIYGGLLLLPAMGILILQLICICAYYFVLKNKYAMNTEQAVQLSGLEYNMISGIQKIKLTGSENRAFTRWLERYTLQARVIYNPKFMERLLPAILALLSIGGTGILYWFTMRNGIEPSNFIAFNSAYGMMAASINELGTVIVSFSQLKPLLNSVKPIMEAVPEIEAKAPQVDFLTGSIDISHVSFRYTNDGPMVLNDIDLHILPGEYVGIVGKSGCGKSTLMRLLLGFEKPISGGIFYDQYDLAKIDKTSLRRKIGCCLQSGSLFTGDIFHNITITAPWSTHEDAWEALRMSSMEEDVRRMPMGLHTVVSEGGGGFSGGQKQRILIARALISRPDIIFFDEATSALDNISQKQVSDNLDQLACTRVIIAHRLSTIRHCDRIIVLDKGKIAEEGNFEELMEKKGLFYEMSLRQL
jgi:NHLM bacteriocin system ABC transporter ATP-binding protein